VWDAVEAADVVVHAGDWVSLDLLEELERRSRRLVACWGNNDGPELRARLPEVARVELAGVRLAVVHETGDAKGREKRAQAAYDDVDVLVFGHSHIPWDTTTESGLRLLNPGSPTDRRRQPHCTYMTCRVEDGRLHDVTLHRLPPRT
jgi:putative phosphoesterase